MKPDALGFTARLVSDGVPAPNALIAVTRNTYAVPLVSPVTVAVVPVETPSLNVFHAVTAVDADLNSTQ